MTTASPSGTSGPMRTASSAQFTANSGAIGKPKNGPRSGARRISWGWIMRSEEHTSELQSLMRISYAVLCLKKKKIITKRQHNRNLVILYDITHKQLIYEMIC